MVGVPFKLYEEISVGYWVRVVYISGSGGIIDYAGLLPPGGERES